MDRELFATTAWSLWNNRNTVRHGKIEKHAKAIVQEVAKYVEEFRKESPFPLQKPKMLI